MAEKKFNLGQNIVKWVGLICVGFLAITGLVLYCEDTSWYDYYQLLFNPLYTIGSLIVFVLIYILIINFIKSKPNWNWKKIGFIACLIIGVLSFSNLCVVSNDQLNIYLFILKIKGKTDEIQHIANQMTPDYRDNMEFMFSNYYLYWPNTLNNIFYQCLFPNQLYFYIYNFILYIYTYRIGLKLFPKEIKHYFAVLFLMCTPIALYICFFYGEITAIFGITASIYLIKRIKEDNKWYSYVLLTIINFLMVWEKENMLIFVIAEILCLILFWIKEIKSNKSYKSLICIGLLLMSTALVNPVVSKISSNLGYEKNKIDSLSYVAMGLHDNADECNYAYPIITCIEGGYDKTNTKLLTMTLEEATQDDIQDIKKSLNHYVTNPKHAIKFFFNKIVKQWNSNDFDNNAWIRKLSLYNRKASENGTILEYNQNRNAINISNMFLSNGERMFIYIISTVALFLSIKNKKHLSYIETVCVVMFIGNFLFSIIWEAKPRYCIYGYFTLLIFSALQIKNILYKDKTC